jgi:hypothetical protein
MAGNIDFITSNPAVDAYQKAEKLADDTRLNDQKMRSSIREESEKQQTFPTRLRKMEADTSSAETGAQVAKAEAPYAAPMKAAGLRQANATAGNTENAWFGQSLTLLQKGDIEGAKALAEQYGHTIPQSVIDDADTRKVVTESVAEAQRRYVNRPKDQQTYILSRIDAANERRNNGVPAYDRTDIYAPKAAPEPQETSDFKSRWDMLPATRTNPDTGQPEQGYIHHDKTSGDSDFVSGTTLNGKNGGGLRGATASSATERIISELMSRGHKYEDALALAKRAPNADTVALRYETMALQAAKQDPDWYTNPQTTIEKYRKNYGLGPRQQLAPPTAPAPTSVLPGPNETVTGVTSTPAPIAQPGTGPARPSAGNGTQPLNIQAPARPPSIPPTAGYSPGTKRWFTPDGQAFDEYGAPVT